MPDFMVLIQANEADEARLPPAETRALVEGHAAFEQQLRAVSAFLDGERLRPSGEGRRVSVREGRLCVEPVPGDAAALAGYYLLRAETLDVAVTLAKECPLPPGASLDVRPVMKGGIKPAKSSHQGHVFAFAVLGQAPDEQGWIEVMDRIDVSTSDHFAAEQLLGGVRLEAPGRGRRLTSTGGHRAVFDGPFLESKEVIGGLFFMRMSTLDEAVQWAGGTAFVQHGMLEIRELWRS